ncbi:DUF5956 family protein [Streptomyces niveus]|uniref:DUF5956 family protein n=1 Tax=Streptomyces niveus TaxID=193462 RepID=UPI0036C24B71
MDWGWDEPPNPQVRGRVHQSDLESDRLPETRELIELGWTLVSDVPTAAFRPFVWPSHARTWVPDRSTVWSLETCANSHFNITKARCLPLSAEERNELEAQINRELMEVGVPKRPPGRLWFLRPVGGFRSVGALNDHVLAMAEERGLDQLRPGLVQLWEIELARLDG